MKYKTILKNNRKQSVSLRSPRNYMGAFFVIPSTSSLTINFNDENYMLVPYEKIVFKKNGKVDCQDRKGYKASEKRFPSTSFLNSGGAELECILLESNNTIKLPKGIEITIEMPLFCYYSEFERVEIGQPKVIPTPGYMSPGTIKYESKPNFIYKKRSPADLKKLKEMREAAYLRRAGFKLER